MNIIDSWIPAVWSAPSCIKAGCTTRQGGFSQGPYSSLNLALHVKDVIEHVNNNRSKVREQLQLPSQPVWLNQVHGCYVINAEHAADFTADGAYCHRPGKVLAVLTADCLPLLLCNRQGSEIAALHCGWRGIVNGIITQGIQLFSSPTNDIIAWLGPAISAHAYEVDDTVRNQFVSSHSQLQECFTYARPGHYFLDLYKAARLLLIALGITAIYGGRHCTFQERDRFFSYRRDNVTGRMATLIWIDST